MSVLSERRKERKLKVEDVATALKVTTQTLYNWEQYRYEPNITQLIKLSEILKISVSKIIKDFGHHYNK